jgi:hypothetical protein
MDILAHCRAMAAFCRQRVAFEKMRMMHFRLEKQKHNLCYWSWHFVNV